MARPSSMPHLSREQRSVLLLLAAAAAATTMLLLSSVEASAAGPHITDLNVLLPPRMTNPVEYRLQGTGGCFSWSWDHHDVLSVRPEYNDSSRCSTSARLISIAPYTGRKETAVYATDFHTGTVIRCEVFIDRISSIKIFHHSLKLELDGLATLHIHAFDSEDNVFSSLVGLQFLWQLDPVVSEADDIHRLVHVPLQETPLSDCGGICGDLDIQIELEDKGVFSDLYVVKGIAIGHETVTSQLLETTIENVTDRIVLTVVEAMSIDPPSPVFVSIGSLIRYSVRVIRRNSPRVVDMPSTHHRWSVTNSSVTEIDSMLGIAHTLSLGSTEVIVEDIRVSAHIQTSSLHVVVPDKLCLYIMPVTKKFNPLEGRKTILPSDFWYVFPGQDYAIYLKLFSQGPDSKEMYISENNDLKLETDNFKDWNILSTPDDVATDYALRYSRLLKPISPGHGMLIATVSYHDGNSAIPQVLKTMQKVIICNKVLLSIEKVGEGPLQFIYLPWAPGISQEAKLNAIGGCDEREYIWSSSDEAIASVSSSGVIQAKWPGQTIVKVVSNFDSTNSDEVLVEVSIPASMHMLQRFPVETVVGKQFQASVTLKTSNGNYYYKCDSFNLLVRWKLSSDTASFRFLNASGTMMEDELVFKEVYALPDANACSLVQLYASSPGRALLHAILPIELEPSFHSFGGSDALEVCAPLAAYSPLVVYQAVDGNQCGGYWIDVSWIYTRMQSSDNATLDELYLVPGSHMDIFFLGGPERWSQEVEYVEGLDILDEQGQFTLEGVHIQEMSSSFGRLHRVLCQDVGDFKLLFSRGNVAGDNYPTTVIEKVQLPVICSFPSLITLTANEPASIYNVIEDAVSYDRSLERIRTSPVIVVNNRTIRMAATAIHMNKRPFANASSLCLRWELSGCEGLAHWNDNVGVLEGAWERFLFLHDAQGTCTVRATVAGFCKSLSIHGPRTPSVSFGSASNVLTDALHLQLVSLLRVFPEYVLLVYENEAKASLLVSGGTCFLNAFSNDTQVIEISQPPKGTENSNFVLISKGLGVAVVTVHDTGLPPPASAAALVRVANVWWVKIISQEDIDLMVGTVRSFNILAGTDDGSVFDASQYIFMKIHVHLDYHILALVNEHGSSRISGMIFSGSVFSIKALAAGSTTLCVSLKQQSGHEIVSQILKVEVYLPLKVQPGYLYLLPGASFALTVKGGPKGGGFIKFASLNDETATVHGSSGKVLAVSAGNASVHAAVYGNDGAILCEAYGKVEVGVPSEMSVRLQSDHLCIGCAMPVFPSFAEGDLFSFYGICKNYKWTLDSESVSFDFKHSPIFEEDFTVLSNARNDGGTGFITVIHGSFPGRTKISVFFVCDIVLADTSRSIFYNASAEVRVVSDFPLSLGVPITWVLPPFYITSDILPPSYPNPGSGRHKNIIYSLLKSSAQNNLPEKDTIIIDGSKIRTKYSNSLACVQAKDQKTGSAVVATCVRVAEVAQIRAFDKVSSLRVVHLAVNRVVVVDINYCDDLGYQFYEAHNAVPVEVETNYPDIVSIVSPDVESNGTLSNSNIYLQGRNPGQALVRISISDKPRSSDFFLVSVGSQIFPANPTLQVEQLGNFSLVGNGNQGEKTPTRMSGLKWAAFFFSTLVFILVAIFSFKLVSKPESSTLPPRQEDIPSPASTVHTALGSPATPATPPPFVDYVRRTIDETPYYRRHGRRRFDPQRTY